MKAFLLLFLTIPAVLAKDVKCPDGYVHVKRTPTAKNNHTKDWCLGAFNFTNMGNRDRARSFCISNGSMLSIPESKAEYDTIIKEIVKKNISDPIAIDGQVRPSCKALIFQLQERGANYSTKIMKGRCNIQKELFDFDDANTDPKFVLDHFMYGVPNGWKTNRLDNDPTFRGMNECANMVKISFKGGYFDVSHCGGQLSNGTDYVTTDESHINTVLCGRHPL